MNKSSTNFLEESGVKSPDDNPNKYKTNRFRTTYVNNPSSQYRLGSPTIKKYKSNEKKPKNS